MIKEPGNLSDFGEDALKAWNDAVISEVKTAMQESQTQHFRLLAESDWPDGVSVVDWDGFPRILQNCLGDEKSSQFCDWKVSDGDLGRVLGQDEYCEWRAIRNKDNRLIRVEVTTELAKYWEVLAAYHPMKTLRILGRFAGEKLADVNLVYGGLNPFKHGVTPKERAEAFNRMMVWSRRKEPVKSPYNNGQKAIAFLSKPVSSLRAAVQLFVHASIPYGKKVNGIDVKLNGAEAIASTVQQAIDCRNSDPNMVGRMNEEVWEGRAVAFDNPVGVYIRSFAHNVLLDPDENPIPKEWVDFQRGSRPHNGGGEERSQRLVIEVPPGMGFILEDLINKDTNENIKYGYQIAELVKAACYFKTSKKNIVKSPKNIVTVNPIANCSSNSNCSLWNRLYSEFEQSQSPIAMDSHNELTRSNNFLI